VNENLPHDTGAEMATLGALLLDPARIPEIAQIAPPEDFYSPRHEEIAAMIYSLHEEGRRTDMVSLASHMMATGRIVKLGGSPYLQNLVDAAPGGFSGPHHAEIVRKHAQLRLLATTGAWLQSAGTDPGTDLQDVPDLLAKGIDRLRATLERVPLATVPATGDLIEAALDAAEHADDSARIKTGFRDLDELYNGHTRGHLIIIGARPSVGKTVVATDFARAAAIVQRVPTLYATLEIGTPEIMARLLAAESKVNLTRIIKAQCTAEDWARLGRGAAALAQAPLYIHDPATLTVGGLRQSAEALIRTTGLGLIIVDYLQLVTGDKAESRQQQVSGIVRALHALGRDLQVPVIACAQINRGPEGRADKTPMMSDLRESGEIEAAAHTVLLLHREDMYEAESPRTGEIDVIVAKQRAGQRGTVTLAFQGHYARCASFQADTDWTPSGAHASAR
jgi:replicative DNA helicase